MTTRLSNLGTLSDVAALTIQDNDAPMTSGSSAANFKHPWQRRISNDLALADGTRHSNSGVHVNTGVRLYNDAPLTR